MKININLFQKLLVFIFLTVLTSNNLYSEDEPFMGSEFYLMGYLNKNYQVTGLAIKQNGRYYLYNAIITKSALKRKSEYYKTGFKPIYKNSKIIDFSITGRNSDNDIVSLGKKNVILLKNREAMIHFKHLNEPLTSDNLRELAKMVWEKYKIYMYSLNEVMSKENNKPRRGQQ